MFVTDAKAVKYHQQDADGKCGEAVAQMLLASLNAQITEQSDLFLPDNPMPSAEELLFSTAPVELARLLNRFQDDPTKHDFDRHIDGNAALTVQRVVQSLHEAKIPVPVMVYRKLHWILVCNALLEQVNGTPRLRGFFLHNPWPVTARNRAKNSDGFPPQPFPHAAADACGNFNGHPNFGAANEYITSAAWNCCYAFAPAEVEGQEGFVSVTPQPAGTAVTSALEVPGPSNNTAPQKSARVEAANAALAAEGLREIGPLADALKDAEFTFVAGEVEVIDVATPGTSYYSVVFKRPGIPTAGVALFDAVRGDFWGLRVYGANAPDSAGFLTPKAVQDALQRDRPRIEAGFGRETAATTIENPSFRLVWTPSLETRSPFMPVALIDTPEPSPAMAKLQTAPKQRLFVTPFGSVVHGDLTK